MGNGKIQKLKDELNKDGCFFGKFVEKDCKRNAEDINNIGKKISLILTWLIIVAILVVTDLGTKAVPYLFKLLAGG